MLVIGDIYQHSIGGAPLEYCHVLVEFVDEPLPTAYPVAVDHPPMSPTTSAMDGRCRPACLVLLETCDLDLKTSCLQSDHKASEKFLKQLAHCYH